MAIPSRGFATDYYGGEVIRCAKFVVPDEAATFVMPKTCPYNDNYIFQGVMKAEAARTITVEMGGESKDILVSTAFKKYTTHFNNVTPSSSLDTKIIFPPGTYYLWNMMVERATSPSDWRPAPEDAEDYANEIGKQSNAYTNSAEERAKVYAEERARGAVEAQTQADIFNKLTDGGQTQGIYLQNGKVYINGTYIQSGTIVIAKGDRETFYANVDTGDVRIVADSFSLSSGETLASTLADAESYADSAASSAVSGQTQADIFNKLTNNGQTQGIYLQNGKVYINGEYIQTGVITDKNGNNRWDLTNGYLTTSKATIGAYTIDTDGSLTYDNDPYFMRMSTTGFEAETSGVGTKFSYTGMLGWKNNANKWEIRYDHNTHQLWFMMYASNNAVTRFIQLSGADNASSQRRIDLNAGYVQLISGELFAQTLSGTNLTITGTKSRKVDAGEYSDRLLYCYETPSPMFGDVGEGEIGEDGLCYIWLEPVFARTVSSNKYQVFLQKYGEGDVYIYERTPDHFIVKGSPNLKFGWEIKAKQAGFEDLRLERDDMTFKLDTQDYGELAANYISDLYEGRRAS